MVVVVQTVSEAHKITVLQALTCLVLAFSVISLPLSVFVRPL